MKRAIIIVLDSVGIGELPDASDYGDIGSNTLINIKKAVPSMALYNLVALGLSHINGASDLRGKQMPRPQGAYGKLAERSKGKDTITGHWEIAGIWLDRPFPTFPDGFPEAVIAEFESRIGRKTIGNYAASGTEIINELGEEHVVTGKPIVYTSADSVFQIAMHEGIIPIEEQYEISQIARDMLVPPFNVSRVITRPFIGETGSFTRTSNRRDFAIVPPGDTMLDLIKAAGLTVAAVGKIEDIFCGRGITQTIHTVDNNDGIDKTIDYMRSVKDGLIFTNLVDFDMIYGHRNNAEGYARALGQFDKRLPEILSVLRKDDLLFITADHGCDPTTPSTDHSREYIPLVVTGGCVRPDVNLGILDTFADIGATVLDWLGVKSAINGKSFLNEIIE